MKTNQVNESKEHAGDESGLLKTEQGFTRGPWKAVGYSPGWWQIEGPEGEQIADVNYSDGLDEPTLYPEEANARLIAAAPELYDAVSTLLSAMEMQEGREKEELHIPQGEAWHAWTNAKFHARAALALVDGPQNKETK